jgi:hypothetical protein
MLLEYPILVLLLGVNTYFGDLGTVRNCILLEAPLAGDPK